MTTYKRLSEIIAPAFYDVHRAVKNREYDEFILKGGRGSMKSSYASCEPPLLIVQNPDLNAVVVRKIGNTLRTSVYAQYTWAITMLGLYDKFKFTVSPMEIVYKPTGQKIMFFGADDPGKLKSLKVAKGYIGILHFEELDQFAGEEEIRNIEQSVLRGGDITYRFKTFNPPQTANNWANKYCMIQKPGQLIHHSTYLEAPPEWLGQTFINDAEYLKTINPRAYEHEYLGIANGTGGMVFENIELREITDEEIRSFERCYKGIDWGYYPDPFAYNDCAYKANTRTLYIFDELTLYKHRNEDSAKKVKAKKVTENDLIYADSAEQKSVADYKSYGFAIRGVEKFPGSVNYTMKWLQGCTKIVIDPVRCPDTAKEFMQYEYEKTKTGEIISGYPDKDNHHIDAVRYAMNPVWRVRGQ